MWTADLIAGTLHSSSLAVRLSSTIGALLAAFAPLKAICSLLYEVVLPGRLQSCICRPGSVQGRQASLSVVCPGL